MNVLGMSTNELNNRQMRSKNVQHSDNNTMHMNIFNNIIVI